MTALDNLGRWGAGDAQSLNVIRSLINSIYAPVPDRGKLTAAVLPQRKSRMKTDLIR
jgi:hypothetical protein